MEASREAVVDLLGVLAYGELIGFERLAEDARLAPTLADKAELARLAATEFSHYDRIAAHLAGMGVAPDEAMAPFAAAIDEFHAATRPGDWLEGLVKAYVGDGMAADFYREMAVAVDPATRAIVDEALADTGHAQFVVERVRSAVAADATLAGRLALWARRIVGEALAQAHRVAVARPALARALAGGEGDVAEFARTLTRLTEGHGRRMAALGLSA